MGFVLSLEAPATEERVVRAGESEFFVTVRRPDVHAQLRDSMHAVKGDWSEMWRDRLNHVIGWRDVVDKDGKAIDFNQRTFGALTANATVLDALLVALQGLFQPDRAREKNSESLPNGQPVASDSTIPQS